MDNALELISQARASGALTFASQNLECPPLYKVEASVINVAPKDFHDKEVNGKLLPRKEIVDKIGDAAGISFIQLNNEHSIDRMEAEPALDLPARSVFVAKAQGKVRLSDGSWRTSTVETYAFDYVARATAEEPTDAFKRKKKMQEYYKAGPMRAASGARLRVIRQLTGMPNGFTPEEIRACQGKLVFSRIVQNTDFILSTPEGKMMAIAMATGAAQLLYGPKAADTSVHSAAGFEPSIEPDGEPPMRPADDQHTSPSGSSPADLAAQAASGSDLDDAFRLEPEPSGTSSVDPEIGGMIQSLTDYVATGMLPKDGEKMIQDALDRKERDKVVLQDLVSRAKKAYDAVMERRRAGAAGKPA